MVAALDWCPAALTAGPLTEVHAANVPAYYEAYCYFGQLLNRPELALYHKLAAGDVLLFNNRRVLHARTGFSLAPGETRLLEGSYCSTDDYESVGMSSLTPARFYRDKLIWRGVPDGTANNAHSGL